MREVFGLSRFSFGNDTSDQSDDSAATSFFHPLVSGSFDYTGLEQADAGSVEFGGALNTLPLSFLNIGMAHGTVGTLGETHFGAASWHIGMNQPLGHGEQSEPAGDVFGRSDYVGPRTLGNGPENYGLDTAVKTVSNTTSIGTTGNFQNQDVNGLLSGVAWNTTNLTYSFPTAASNYGVGYSDPAPSDGFQALSSDQQNVVRYALGLVSQYTDLTFTEVTETDSSHATLRFSGSAYPSTSYAYYPADTDSAGDAFYGNIRNDAPTKAGYEFDTIMHEIGHTLGLKHGQDDDGTHGVLPSNHNSTEWSIMDYHSYVGADLFYRNPEGSGNQTYMVDDISALQYMYGANFNTHSENTVYTWSPTTGEEFINGVGQGASSTDTVYEAIWDGNGTDTYNLSNYTTNLSINLNPGNWSTFSSDQLAYLDSSDSGIRAPGNIDNANEYNNDPRSLIENAIGGSGNDVIVGNSAANTLNGGDGNDNLNGGAGNDTLKGGIGNDTLNGGGGTDALIGGAGDDTYIVNAAGATITENLNAGTDLVKTTLSSFTLGANLENLTYTGTGNFVGTGNTLANIITGHGGNDTLNGGGGADTLIGANGNDTYIVGNAGVTITEAANGGTDTVKTSLSTFTLITNLENLVYTGTAAFKGTGNAAANSITGGAGADTLKGLGGADHLTGGGGNDIFYYGSAADSTGKPHDTVTDFDALHDHFDVPGKINGINHAIVAGSLSTGSFDSDMAKAVGKTQLAAHHALEFTPNAGGLKGDHFLVIDVNGVAGYQAGADLVIQIDNPLNMGHFGVADFI